MENNIAAEEIKRDFDRDVWCILGLPFDNRSMEDVQNLIDDCIKNGLKCIFSTPNLNWVMEALKYPDFKKSVIKSDISTVDGAPILWTAGLLGIPIKERVPGSTLTERILSGKRDRAYKLFLLGGRSDAAEKAAARINAAGSNARSVGYCNPGYGTLEDISNDDVIRKINEADPDILLVSLGARKGMAWIEKNRDRVNARIMSHLGATIYFISGQVKRAPVWMQKAGIEWIWRMMQEPVLTARYLRDGIIFLRLIICRILPNAVFIRKHRAYMNAREEPVVKITEESGAAKVSISGICNRMTTGPIRDCFKKLAAQDQDVILDLSGVDFADNSFLGLLLLLLKYKFAQNRKLVISDASISMRRILKFNMLDDMI